MDAFRASVKEPFILVFIGMSVTFYASWHAQLTNSVLFIFYSHKAGVFV